MSFVSSSLEKQGPLVAAHLATMWDQKSSWAEPSPSLQSWGKQIFFLKSLCQRKERSYERGKDLSSQGSRQWSSSSLHGIFSVYALNYDLHIPALRRVSRFRNGEATDLEQPDISWVHRVGNPKIISVQACGTWDTAQRWQKGQSVLTTK